MKKYMEGKRQIQAKVGCGRARAGKKRTEGACARVKVFFSESVC